MHRALCGAGPFERVDRSRFAQLLRTMAAAGLLSQASDGTLLHGPAGERMVNHYSFYTAFLTPEEWRLVANGSTLGTLPISYPLTEGSLLIFAGRRWRVVGIDPRASEGRRTDARCWRDPPKFGGGGAMKGHGVRAGDARHRGADEPSWLNPNGKVLLAEGRDAWRRLQLDCRVLIASGKSTTVLPWVGDHALVTVAFLLAEFELRAERGGTDHPDCQRESRRRCESGEALTRRTSTCRHRHRSAAREHRTRQVGLGPQWRSGRRSDRSAPT